MRAGCRTPGRGSSSGRSTTRPTSSWSRAMGVDAIITNRPREVRLQVDQLAARRALGAPAVTRVRAVSKRRASPRHRRIAAPTDGDVPVVGGREPCPCGSGRRYKACHGKAAATQHRVVRPFAGLASEPDWVALHDLVPAATATLTPKESDRSVTLCTLLPMAWPALVRQNGDVLLGRADPDLVGGRRARPRRRAGPRPGRRAGHPGAAAAAAGGRAARSADLIDADATAAGRGPLRLRLLARGRRGGRRERSRRARAGQRGRQSHGTPGVGRGCLLDAAG